MKNENKENHAKRSPAKTGFAQKRHLIHEVISDPFLDWFLIFTSAFIILAALVGMGIYVYLDAGNRLAAPPPEIIKKTAPIDAKALQSALDGFDARTANRASLIKNYNAPKDPSLP